MTDKHFTLDVDPDGLRDVATRMGTLKGHIETKAGTVKGTPGEIGDGWTGDAATSVKTEMTGLGNQMDRFADKLQPAIAALRSLARDYDDALARLPELNRKWEATETAYQNAIDASQTHVDETKQQWVDDGRTINRTLQHELDTMRTSGSSAAYSERQTAQHNLEIDFGYLKMWLGQQTRALSGTLTDAVPFPISADDLDKWQAGEHPHTPLDAILGGMSLTRQIKDAEREAEIAEELAQKHAEAREEAKDDIEALNDALEDGDTEAIQEALDEIGENADDPIYSEELVHELGADGVNELYGRMEELISDGDVVIDEFWPHLKGLNDAVAHGMESLDGKEFGEFMEQMNDNDYFQRQLALIAGSDYAGGKVSAAAMAYYSQVYISDPSASMGRGLYPEVFHYAYDLDNENLLDVWDAKVDGNDLVEFLRHMDEGDRQDLYAHLLQFGQNGEMSEDELLQTSNLYGEALVDLKARHLTALDESAGATPDLLLEMLEYRYEPEEGQNHRSDPLQPYLADIVNDPEFATWYMNASRTGVVPATTFKDILGQSGVKPEDVIASIMEYQIERGDNPEQVANNLGTLMREQDLLGDDIKWGGVVKSLAESLISAGAKTPLTGPTLGVFNALLGEIQRLEKADQDLDDAMGKNGPQQLLAFTLYTEVNGGPPEGYTFTDRDGDTVEVLGFEEYLEEENLEDDDERAQAINLYYTYLEGKGGPADSPWEDMQNYFTLIDEARDEQ